MLRLYYDFMEKILLGHFDWQMFFFSREHTINLLPKSIKTLSVICFFFLNMNRYIIIAELLLVLTVELKFQLFNNLYNVIIISEHCSQELKDTHL